MMQKPKDCVCGFHSDKHLEWCPSAKRLAKRKASKEEVKAAEQEEDLLRDKDAYGRWQAGVGPKPDFVKD